MLKRLNHFYPVFFVATAVFLAGCVEQQVRTPVSGARVGPATSAELEEQERSATTVTFADAPASQGTRLDVIVATFDPGLSKKAEAGEEEGIWPELRRAEANRFAWKLKEAMEDTRAFGAVRVMPDATATGELYVLGKILESNGEEVKVELEVVDAANARWMKDRFDHKVPEKFYDTYRNQGKDPYEPLFTEAAESIAALLQQHSAEEKRELKSISTLRFASHLDSDVFSQYLSQSRGKINLQGFPSRDDPRLQRVSATRVREQLFVDGMQKNYADFSSQMEESYSKWQEASQLERIAYREAKGSQWAKILGGALLIGLAAYSATEGGVLGDTGAVLGGLAGAWMLSESFQSKEEAEFHKTSLAEMGQSVDLEFGPQVVEFEQQTTELQGNAKEQFAQWRAFLKRIHAQEQTPDIAL